MDILELTGEKVRQLREDLNWTRDKLSEVSGVPSRTIQDIETGGSKNPGIETFKILIKSLPNYEAEKRAPQKAQLILDIQARLTALDENQLRSILKLTLTLPAVDLSNTVVKTSKINE